MKMNFRSLQKFDIEFSPDVSNSLLRARCLPPWLDAPHRGYYCHDVPSTNMRMEIVLLVAAISPDVCNHGRSIIWHLDNFEL